MSAPSALPRCCGTRRASAGTRLTLAAFERQLTPRTSVGGRRDRQVRPPALLIEAAHGAARDDRNEHVARAALSLARRILDGLRHDGGDGGAGLRLEALCLMADAYAELPDKTSAEYGGPGARAATPRAEGVGGRLSVIEKPGPARREEDALALAREVDAEEEGLAAVAAARLRRGDEPAALKLAAEIVHLLLQQQVQTEFAILHAQHGRWEEAYAAAEAGFPAIALSEILREQALAWDADGVARTLELFQGPEEDKAWNLLRRAYLRTYDLAGSKRSRRDGLRRARGSLLHEGRRDEALAIAEGWRRTRDAMRAFDLAELALEAARLVEPIEYDPFGVDF